MDKALVILSGGQDSTTCLLMAINKFRKENVHAISFIYNNKYKANNQNDFCNFIEKLKIKYIDYKNTFDRIYCVYYALHNSTSSVFDLI